MTPTLALILWLVLLVGLLIFDPGKDSRPSLALWVPLVWTFFVGARLPSQWLGSRMRSAALAFEEGNPLDRSVFLVLILLALGILISRSFRWRAFFAGNLVLMAFLCFTLLSVFWADFPFVSFKRWFRDLGNYLAILVVLSDPCPLEAVRTLLRRLSYLLIPLSVLLIKYYPYLAKQYNPWTGAAEYIGAMTSKNMLGNVCLVSGVFFFWDTVTRWFDRKERPIKRILLLNIAFIAMTLWLLKLSNSATSGVCLVIGCLVIIAVHARTFRRHPAVLKVLIPASFCLYLLLAFGLNLSGTLAAAVGRDPTLTDRTLIWKILLDTNTNPLIGTGYDNFWLGPRLMLVWQKFGLKISEAHNGYLEIYLNLGLIGLALIVGLLFTSFRNICRKLSSPSGLASLTLAIWVMVLFYNVTEAAFKFHLMWNLFLLAAINVPARAENTAPVSSPLVAQAGPGYGIVPSKRRISGRELNRQRIRSVRPRSQVE
jgi:O-antigen ligase